MIKNIMFFKESKKNFLDSFVWLSWIALMSSSLLQIILFPTIDNTLASICVITAWLILTSLFLKSKTLKAYPLSTFLIIGFTATQFYFPLIFTLLEGKPVVFNLELPLQVFAHSLLCLIILSIAHLLYQKVNKLSFNNEHTLLNKASFFTPPTELQLWIMGIIGLSCAFYVHLYAVTASKTTGAASDKVLEALVPFSYAPFFIPFGKLYGNNKKHTASLILPLLFYTLVLFAISIARNSRGAFMIGFTSLGFAYLLGLLLGYYQTRILTLRNILVVTIAFWLFTGPIADIGTAMVLVRQQRSDIAYTELMGLTFEAFNDKEAIRIYRLSDIDLTENREWDENYLNNIFIARFSNLKFNDTSLLLASKIREGDSDILNFTIDHFLSTFPLPVLETFGVQIDKESVNHVSFGDYLLAKVSGNPQVLGSFLTGHFAGLGMAAFGWWYLAILGVGIVPVYFLYDKLVTHIRHTPYPGAIPTIELRFSFCGLLSLTAIFQFLPAESVESIAAFLVRGWLQMIILYFCIFHITFWLSRATSFLHPNKVVAKRYRTKLVR
jgi:hypothetical protein